MSVDFISHLICHNVPSDGCTVGRDQLCPKFPGEVRLWVRIKLHLLFSSCWPGRVWKPPVELFSPQWLRFFVPYGYVYVREGGLQQLSSRRWCQCQRRSSFLVKQLGWAWFWRSDIVSKCHFQSSKSFCLKSAQLNFINRGWLQKLGLSRWTFSLLIDGQMVFLLCWIYHY